MELERHIFESRVEGLRHLVVITTIGAIGAVVVTVAGLALLAA